MITTVAHADTQCWLKIPYFVRSDLRMRLQHPKAIILYNGSVLATFWFCKQQDSKRFDENSNQPV